MAAQGSTGKRDAALAHIEREFPQLAQRQVPLAGYTAARIGGPAELLLTVGSAEQLEQAMRSIWDVRLRYLILGGGSNVLVADQGVRGVVVLNQARAVQFDPTGVHAESGASIGSIARRAVERGQSGLEWAGTVPGTVGGAVVGNAGAHDGDTAGSLEVAEILQRAGAGDRSGAGKTAGAESGENGPAAHRRSEWDAERLEFDYRSSWLKRHPGQAAVLGARFKLEQSDPERTKSKLAAFVEHRRQTQPGGASMGSMFKNPPDDFAGRLIEAAGLKGERRGQAEISPLHANFFINHGGASAAEVFALIQTARDRVVEQFGIELELEIELIGDWQRDD